jgi:hypothetical protein
MSESTNKKLHNDCREVLKKHQNYSIELVEGAERITLITGFWLIASSDSDYFFAACSRRRMYDNYAETVPANER